MMRRSSLLGIRAVVVIVVVAAAVTRTWLAAQPPRGIGGADLLQFFVPLYTHVGRELADGHLLLWNPYLGFGTSAVAEIQSGMFYPPNLLYALLPTTWAIEVLAAAHVALAAATTFLLCSATGVGSAGSVVAAVALATGAALHALAAFPSLLSTVAWAPAAFLCTRRLADRPGAGRGLAVAAVLGLQLMAGYPQIHLFTLVLLPLFVVPTERPWRALAWLAAAEVTAGGLAAIAIAPAFAAVGASIRSQAALRRDLYALFPVTLGSYRAGVAGPVVDGGAPVFMGPLVPLLALGGVLARGKAPRLRLSALGLTAACALFSLGEDAPLLGMLWRLPRLSYWLTGTWKWTYLVAVGLALLAGIGTDAFLSARSLGTTRRWCWVALGGVLLAAVPFAPNSRLLGGALLAFLALAPDLSARRPAAAGLVLAALGVLTVLSATRARPFRAGDWTDVFERPRAAYRYLAERQAEGRTVVLFFPPLRMSARQGEIEGVAQLNTYETFFPLRLFQYLVAVGQAAQGDTTQQRQAIGLLRSLGVRFVMVPHEGGAWLATVGLTRVFGSPGADVWEDDGALPRAYIARRIEHAPANQMLSRLADPGVAAGHAAVLERDEEGDGVTAGPAAGEITVVPSTATRVELDVRVDAPALLVLLDAWSPDWRATVDGRAVRVRRANLLGRAVELAAGRHVVVFTFAPLAFWLGAVVSLATLLGAILVAVTYARRARLGAGPTARGS